MSKTKVDVYSIGEVTEWFRGETKSHDVKAILDKAKIECVEVANIIDPDEILWQMIGPPPTKAKTFRVSWQGFSYQFKPGVTPRDVWCFLKGIGFADAATRKGKA